MNYVVIKNNLELWGFGKGCIGDSKRLIEELSPKYESQLVIFTQKDNPFWEENLRYLKYSVASRPIGQRRYKILKALDFECQYEYSLYTHEGNYKDIYYLVSLLRPIFDKTEVPEEVKMIIDNSNLNFLEALQISKYKDINHFQGHNAERSNANSFLSSGVNLILDEPRTDYNMSEGGYQRLNGPRAQDFYRGDGNLISSKLSGLLDLYRGKKFRELIKTINDENLQKQSNRTDVKQQREDIFGLSSQEKR